MFSPSLAVGPASPSQVALQRSAQIQADVFSQTQEDVITACMVRPGAAVAADGSKGHENLFGREAQAVPVMLVLTVTRTRGGYRDPKLHYVKVKGPTKWSVKNFRLLKTIDRVLISQTDSHSFNYFTVGDGRRYDWHVTGQDASMRDEFLWWMLHSMRFFASSKASSAAGALAPPLPNNNIEEAVLNNLLGKWSRVMMVRLLPAFDSDS